MFWGSVGRSSPISSLLENVGDVSFSVFEIHSAKYFILPSTSIWPSVTSQMNTSCFAKVGFVLEYKSKSPHFLVADNNRPLLPICQSTKYCNISYLKFCSMFSKIFFQSFLVVISNAVDFMLLKTQETSETREHPHYN